MTEFKAVGAIGSVEKIENVDEGEIIYRYYNFSCELPSGEIVGFPEGYITKIHLAKLEGTEKEKLTIFFEKLIDSYAAREKGDLETVNSLYAEIGLEPLKGEPLEITL